MNPSKETPPTTSNCLIAIMPTEGHIMHMRTSNKQAVQGHENKTFKQIQTSKLGFQSFGKTPFLQRSPPPPHTEILRKMPLGFAQEAFSLNLRYIHSSTYISCNAEFKRGEEHKNHFNQIYFILSPVLKCTYREVIIRTSFSGSVRCAAFVRPSFRVRGSHY